MSAVNDGMAADYLVSVTDFDAERNTVNSSSDARNAIRNRSFLRCLSQLKLEDIEAKKIRIALGEYDDCKESAVQRARATHSKLQEKYNDLAHEQAKLLRAGKITKAEYDSSIARLRHAFQKELRALQLKEKLNDALRNCHKILLRQINGILSERQWKAFVDCSKN